MGSIVGAFATSHILGPKLGVEDKAARVVAGMKVLGERVRALKPDVLFLISSDHMVNFNLKLQAPFIVAVAEEHMPFGEMGGPARPFPGHREFAEAFVRFAAQRGFDLAKAEEVSPDHGVALPVLVACGRDAIPVVPFYVNSAMDPVPSPGRCWALGDLLRQMVESARPAAERVVVLGTGGLSHWLGLPQMGQVNETFDRWVLERLVRGDGAALSGLTAEEILEKAGNGGLEVLNWIIAAGAVGGCRAQALYYEAIPEWLTGMGGVDMGVSQRPIASLDTQHGVTGETK